MEKLEDSLSPNAKLWLERMGKNEEKSAGRVLSQIIEGYMELEEKLGEESVQRLLELMIHGPGRVVEILETEISKVSDLAERSENTLSILRLYCAQLHSNRHIGKNGEIIYRIGKEERELLFQEPDPDQDGGLDIR